MHCNKVLFIVTIVEINMLIIDVCMCHHFLIFSVLMFLKVFYLIVKIVLDLMLQFVV